ncbi:MAG TPA: hypothetical protein PLV32_09415, partial [Chitinophagaceae bacterium]|nr:hypothetical protein [Chitinophagaceae bacterium]
MKSIVLKAGLSLFFAAIIADSVQAQRSGRRRNPPANQPPTQQQQQNNNNTQPTNYNPYGNIPIVVDSSGMSDTTVKKSLRNDNAYDKSSLNARTPLPYEHLRADDALFAEKVWRELDLREKLNQPFRYAAEGDNGSEIFVNILLRAVNTGEVTAFADDRFSTPKTVGEIQQQTVGSADTVPVTDPNDINKIIQYRVTRASFDPGSVTKIALKEEWVFDREA